MIVRKSDFINPEIFEGIVKDAQEAGLITEGTISESSGVNANDISINVKPTKVFN